MLTLLKEKVNKIKSTIYSSRVSPLTYYTSRVLGDIIFNCVLYSMIYGSLYLGAQKLIHQYDMFKEFNGCFFILLSWKIRYVLISYLISHFIWGSIDLILKYYLFIYSIINGGFAVLSAFYPNLPFKYVFDCGDIWINTFNPDYVLDYWELVLAIFVNFVLAIFVSMLIDNFQLNRNYRKQAKARKEFKIVKSNYKRDVLDQSLDNSSKHLCIYSSVINMNIEYSKLV